MIIRAKIISTKFCNYAKMTYDSKYFIIGPNRTTVGEARKDVVTLAKELGAVLKWIDFNIKGEER